MLEHEDLTERIIGAAIDVHRKLGPGFLESIYQAALAIELRKRDLTFQLQVPVPILYDEERIGEHKLDLLVENEIVVELKSVRSFEDIHFRVLKSYLKAAHRKHGLLLNFAATTLQIKRVIAN
ncbi:MAG: GxxExxY protein [Deltaproteobacteria bacterium]|nr:GxxExxY protein [Deltaproteobacteria bacterium]